MMISIGIVSCLVSSGVLKIIPLTECNNWKIKVNLKEIEKAKIKTRRK